MIGLLGINQDTTNTPALAVLVALALAAAVILWWIWVRQRH
jgi:hypothetical protein